MRGALDRRKSCLPPLAGWTLDHDWSCLVPLVGLRAALLPLSQAIQEESPTPMVLTCRHGLTHHGLTGRHRLGLTGRHGLGLTGRHGLTHHGLTASFLQPCGY